MPKKQKKKTYKKPKIIQKVVHKPKQFLQPPKNKLLITTILVSAFILCLFLNSFFNAPTCTNPEGDTVATKYYYLGPDPYYNIRTITETLRLGGRYPYTTEVDPLLNYPLGNNGARPPLFNMIAIFSATLIEQFGVPEIDAIGTATQLLPAIYGALLVFPVYLISKELFGEKVALISAILIPLIPVHLSSGHGSSFALFDHDSFVLLLATAMFFFIIKMLKEKDKFKSIVFTILAGIMLGSISLTWVASHLLYAMIFAFVFVNLYFEFMRHSENFFISLKITILFLTSFLVSLPYYANIDLIMYYPLVFLLFSTAILILHCLFIKVNLPWLLTIPINIGIFGSLFFYIQYAYYYKVIPAIVESDVINSLAQTVFGGLYSTKVETTIAEGVTYGMGSLAMFFGPSLFWLGLVGFCFFLYKTHKEKWKPENVFYAMLFIITYSLLSQAGRFVNDLVPFIAIFSAFTISIILSKLKFPKILDNTLSVYFKWYHITTTIGVFLTLISPFVFLQNNLSPIQSTLYLALQVPCLLSSILIIEDFKNENYISLSTIRVKK